LGFVVTAPGTDIETLVEVTPASDLARLVRVWKPPTEPWGAVLIVHGLGEHCGRHDRTASAFASAGLLVRSFDLEGHGGSGGRRGHVASWDVFVDAVGEELARLRAEKAPVALYGHSMGSAIALSYALSDRPQPDALILSAPPVTGHGLAMWKEWAAKVLGRLTPKLVIPNEIEGEQLTHDKEIAAAYDADPMVLTKSTVGLGRAGFGAVRANAASLDRLRIPTLVIHGGADTVVPPQHSLALARIPTVERRLYPSLRHEIFHEPEGAAVLADVVDWLRRTFTERQGSTASG
jgi:alpha-beta hydrolase superfamily lysophospholipase